MMTAVCGMVCQRRSQGFFVFCFGNAICLKFQSVFGSQVDYAEEIKPFGRTDAKFQPDLVRHVV